ncbi:MAG: hypothetical protein Q8S13_06280 [Dehalococcoidia bacterium]|nr:hypothetical protein [Dehalococcoidia bacterium]
MSFAEWLTRWAGRHPLKTPATDRAAFTHAVMQRLAADRAGDPALPRPAWDDSRGGRAGWLGSAGARWRAGLAAVALATAAVLIAPRLPLPIGNAAAIERDADMLAALGEPVEDDLSDDALAGLLVFAESAPDDDDAWLSETMELLEQLDESLPEDEASDEDWLQELESLDRGASASS